MSFSTSGIQVKPGSDDQAGSSVLSRVPAAGELGADGPRYLRQGNYNNSNDGKVKIDNWDNLEDNYR